MQDNRVGWVDAFRGLAIILVVFGHVGRGLQNAGLWDYEHSFTDDFIYAFHMPAFFFAAGLFARRSLAKGVGHFLLEKVRTVAYPYVLWSVIYILLLKYIPAGNATYDSTLWEKIAYQPVGNYWFLYVLFIVQVIYALIRPLKYGPLMFYALALGLWALESSGEVESLFSHNPYWAWHDVLKYCIYFAYGDAVATLSNPNVTEPRDTSMFALIFFGGLTLLLGFGLNYRQGWWDLPLAVAGIQGLWELSVLCEQRGIRWIQYLGRRSLEIYLAHNFATAAIRVALMKAGIDSIVVHFTLGTIGGIALPLLLCWMCDKVRFRFLFTLGR